ncbi:MAG: hypothetical protein ACTSR2_10910 [Candidatus Hodarchaeales archaeon]
MKKKSFINSKIESYHKEMDLSFPGRKSLLESIENQLDVNGDVWIHHAYNVPTEDSLAFDAVANLEYQDTVIIPSILHTLIDKSSGEKTTSLAAITGIKPPELMLILDPATMNLGVITKERLWITEILLPQVANFFPYPYERKLALANANDPSNIEVVNEDISLEIKGHRIEGGIAQDSAFVPLDSNYKPVLGGKDPGRNIRKPLARSSDIGELILMISDAISSSAKMYLGTVNVRLNEDKFSLKYPEEANIACIKIYSRYIDVIEIKSPSQVPNTELQLLNFRVYRTKMSQGLKRLSKILHLL